MYRVSKRTLTPAQKEKILERDGYVCIYCLGNACEVDHVVPFSWSQCDEPNNLVSCCMECNRIASNFVFDNFDLKGEYIRTIRQGKKWTKKLERAKISYCNECGKDFRPLYNGATMFTCKSCLLKLDKMEIL